MSAHKQELDELTPAQIRVVCEHLLYTMDIKQREKFMLTFPGLYGMIYPEGKIAAAHKFLESAS